MGHPIYRVRSFEIVAPYTLRVCFDDHTDRTINFRPILAGELYCPLQDQKLRRWSGPMARILIPPLCMTGPRTNKLFENWLDVGRWRKSKPDNFNFPLDKDV